MKTITSVASGLEESWVVTYLLQPGGVTQWEEVCNFNFRFGTQPWGLLLCAVIHQFLHTNLTPNGDGTCEKVIRKCKGVWKWCGCSSPRVWISTDCCHVRVMQGEGLWKLCSESATASVGNERESLSLDSGVAHRGCVWCYGPQNYPCCM